MPAKMTAEKSPKRQEQDTRAVASAGPKGIALAPPAYGIDFVDRAPAGDGPLQLTPATDRTPELVQAPAPRRARSTPPNNTGLPDGLKSGIEALSGISMDNVKVHYNSSQPAQLNALAYAQGRDIHVAPGQKRCLPHEAWHLVQQAQGRVKPTMQMKGGVPVNDDEGLEQEADVMGAKALANAAEVQGAPQEQAHLQGTFAPVQRTGPEQRELHIKKFPSAPIQSDPPNVSYRPGQAKVREGEEGASTPLGQKGPGRQSPHAVQPRRHETIGLTPGDVIQRDIGFEFESQEMRTTKVNPGALPAGGFPVAATPRTLSTATSPRIDKGDVILGKQDIEVQADDAAWGGGSDLEVVTTHFPLDNPGRARLDQAMTDLGEVVNAYGELVAASVAANSPPFVLAIALNGIGGFQTRINNAMIEGSWETAKTAGQVTMGIRLSNVGNIVRELHGDPNETPEEKMARDPGRLHMREANKSNTAEPSQLNVLSEANTLVEGHRLAQSTLEKYQQKSPTPPGDDALIGLLTIIFTYCESMKFKRAFLKQHTPLMAKTDLATMFTTLPGKKTNLATMFTKLPDSVQQYYSKKRFGKSNLQELVATAPDYREKMTQPLFATVSGLHEDDPAAMGGPQWYHELKLNDWLEGIVSGVDMLTSGYFPKKPWYRAMGRPQANQQVEGFGALGVKMDTDVNTPEMLPVFELRSATKMITYAQARQWALDFFDYVRSLNENPRGGHSLMRGQPGPTQPGGAASGETAAQEL